MFTLKKHEIPFNLNEYFRNHAKHCYFDLYNFYLYKATKRHSSLIGWLTHSQRHGDILWGYIMRMPEPPQPYTWMKTPDLKTSELLLLPKLNWSKPFSRWQTLFKCPWSTTTILKSHLSRLSNLLDFFTENVLLRQIVFLRPPPSLCFQLIIFSKTRFILCIFR